MSCVCGEQCVGYAGAQVSYGSTSSERAYEDTVWSSEWEDPTFNVKSAR